MGLTQEQVAKRMNVRQELGGRLEVIADIGDERIVLR
jgi:hypothetical protein